MNFSLFFTENDLRVFREARMNIRQAGQRTRATDHQVQKALDRDSRDLCSVHLLNPTIRQTVGR